MVRSDGSGYRRWGLCDRLLAASDLESGSAAVALPHLYIAAVPDRAKIRDFLGPTGVRTFLEEPPCTRSNGWNLTTLDRAQVLDGAHQRVGSGERVRIDLYRDGSMAVLAALPSFIARGSASEPWTIFGLALVEFVYDFFAAYAALLRDWMEPAPAQVGFSFELRKAQWSTEAGEYHLRLSPYEASNPLVGLPLHGLAPNETYVDCDDVSVEAEASSPFPVGELAYRFVNGIYRWYGTDIPVPYATGGIIDPGSFPRR